MPIQDYELDNVRKEVARERAATPLTSTGFLEREETANDMPDRPRAGKTSFFQALLRALTAWTT